MTIRKKAGETEGKELVLWHIRSVRVMEKGEGKKLSIEMTEVDRVNKFLMSDEN